MKNTLVQNVGQNLHLFADQIVHYDFLVTGLFSIFLVKCPCDMRIVVLLLSLLVGTTFMQTPCCHGYSVAGQHHLDFQNLGCYSLLVEKLNMPPKGSDQFRVYGLWLINEMLGTTKEQSLIELQTHFFKFLNVEKVFYMNEWFIMYVDGGDFNGWDNLIGRGVRGGHNREF